MNFDFSEDQKLLQKTARDYLAEHCGLDVCRSVLESNGTHSDALWKGVAEMGWLGAAVPEEYGGAGFGRARARADRAGARPRARADPVRAERLPGHRGAARVRQRRAEAAAICRGWPRAS